MSPSKINNILTGICVAILMIAVSGSAAAQDGLRLWKPYNPESFGGGRRVNDGVYSSVSGIYWTISAPKGGYVGSTTARGTEETRWVYDGRKTFEQTNSVKINMLESKTSLGSRFEVGNRRGHHGWLVTGYGLYSQSRSMDVQNITLTIRDEGNISFQPFVLSHPGANGAIWGGLEIADHIFLWDRNNNSLYDPTAPPNSLYYPFANWQHFDGNSYPQTIGGVGYLWGFFVHGFDLEGTGVQHVAVLAPLPIWFKDVNVNVKSTHRSAELMYTYRPRPFVWGSMELLAGVRYWDFEDEFGFLGQGPGDPAGGAVGNNVNPEFGPISILSDMIVDAKANNRVVGPQVGMKLARHNARWSFGAEGRFTGGINAQMLKTQGYIATNYDYNTNYAGYTYGPFDHEGTVNTEIPIWVPVGLQYNNTNFGHKKSNTYFSPIVDFRLTADWQWTSAVSFFGAAEAMYAGNIARGVRVTDYVVRSDGTIFGIRGDDRNETVAVYGVEVGVKVHR
ncbi:MAG: BBP7 family outer membrane beta-barrel protein [Planctomycetaceae bacterium]|nr:BBP7 family outer membrane beta-barrel protein [Planctomycetaceae bacterium]